jgi:His-Xaa-Ser system protein HxsD
VSAPDPGPAELIELVAGEPAPGAAEPGPAEPGPAEPGPAREIILTFDRATADVDAVQRAAYALADVASADIRVRGAEVACTLYPRERRADRDELRHRFRIEVNDQVLRARIAAQTEPLRDLVFALAFARTGLVGSPDGASPDGASPDDASSPGEAGS